MSELVVGVYEIYNIVNGKVYIGSSVDVYGRWRTHRSQLSRKLHPNAHLMSAWQKYGASAFVWNILEEVADKERLVIIEQQWMERTRCYDAETGYNICGVARSSLGRILSVGTRAKISAALKGKHKGRKFSVAHRARIAMARKGYRHSDEAKAKISAAHKDKEISVETRAKISVAQRGRKFSAETKAKMSVASAKRKYLVISPEGAVFEVLNLKRFCKEHGLNRTCMWSIATGRQKQHQGWRCTYI